MRLTRQDYVDVGFQLLATGGIGEVTIANVCGRLHVTKGSFDHHFESAPAFHRELLAYYEDEYARRRIEEVRAIAGTEDRLVGLSSAASSATTRRRARCAPGVAPTLGGRGGPARRRGAARYLVEFLVAEGVSTSRARVHADVALAIIAGAQAMSRVTDRRKVRAMLDEHCRGRCS